MARHGPLFLLVTVLEITEEPLMGLVQVGDGVGFWQFEFSKFDAVGCRWGSISTHGGKCKLAGWCFEVF